MGPVAPTDSPPEPALPAASEPGLRVLAMARRMMEAKTIIRGSCWDYANAVYRRAGFSGRARQTVFRGRRQRGPYAPARLFRAGDWLYFINHSYHDVQHSAIFVRWVDRRARVALMVTYRGARRAVPGVYDEYDLSHVYRVVRPSAR